MSEEEKKAIFIIKKYIDNLEEDEKFFTTTKDKIITIYNLVEKQQKEIEMLKNIKDNCPVLNTSGVKCDLIKLRYKIRDKIKELQKEIENLKEINKSLEEENNFLKMMYRGTSEFKSIEKLAKEE